MAKPRFTDEEFTEKDFLDFRECAIADLANGEARTAEEIIADALCVIAAEPRYMNKKDDYTR